MSFLSIARLSVLRRALLLLFTFAVLLSAVINFNTTTNKYRLINPYVAVEGDGFIHLTYSSEEMVREQSGLRYFDEETLVEDQLQILLSVIGQSQKRDGRQLKVIWIIDDYYRDENVLRFEKFEDNQSVDSWVQEITSYEKMFDTIVSAIGNDGTLIINYRPSQETSSSGLGTAFPVSGVSANYTVTSEPVPASIDFYVQIAAAMLFLVVGFFVYFGTNSYRGGLIDLLYATCLAFFTLISLHVEQPESLLQWIIIWFNLIALILAPVMLLHFLMRLRAEYLEQRRLISPWYFYIPAFLLLAFTIYSVSDFATADASSAVGEELILREAPLFQMSQLANGIHMVALILIGMVVMIRSSRKEVPIAAIQQFRWVFWGVALGLLPYAIAMYLINPAIRLESPVVNLAVSLLLMVTPVSLGLTVLSRRFIDVDVIFKRGFIYFASSFLLFIVYLGLMFGLQSLSGEIDTGTVVIISGGMILLATLFSHRVKDQVQSFFDRFLHRDFFNFRRTLQRFSLELNYERDLDRLLKRISDHIELHFRIDGIVIFISSANRENFVLAHSTIENFDVNYVSSIDSSRLKQVYSKGNPLFIDQLPESAVASKMRENGIITLIPFLSLGEVIGFLGLGHGRNSDVLNTDDLELLTNFTDRAGPSIDNALLYMDIETRAEAMRILKEYNENILESVDSGICAVNNKGIVQSWNSSLEELFVISRDEAIGRPCLELMPAQLANVMEPYLFGGSETGRFHTLYKVRVPNLGGEEKVLNIAFSPLGEIEDEPGASLGAESSMDMMVPDTFSGTVLFFVDVTEGVSMEEKLQQQEKLAGLGLLSAGVAHEVNTPLAGISSYVQMLQRKTADNQELRSVLDKIDKQVLRASKIINNLLNFSRQGASSVEKLDLNPLIKDSLLLVENQLRGREIKLNIELAESLPLVRGDKVKLQQVLLNLILNARDSIQNEGTITVSSTARGDTRAEIRVRDTGVGIPAESIPKIFDPFFTTKRMGEGTGLGLSVTYGIIQELNGEINVESEVGKGTTFIVSLPAAGTQDR